MKDDSGHTADEYTENETIKKLIKANKEEVRLDSRHTSLWSTLATGRHNVKLYAEIIMRPKYNLEVSEKSFCRSLAKWPVCCILTMPYTVVLADVMYACGV